MVGKEEGGRKGQGGWRQRRSEQREGRKKQKIRERWKRMNVGARREILFYKPENTVLIH